MGAEAGTGSTLSCPVLLPRYPRVMVEEGLRAVRQWLEASTQLEEGEVSRGWWAGPGKESVLMDSSLSPSLRLQSLGGGGGLVRVCASLLPGRAWA